ELQHGHERNRGVQLGEPSQEVPGRRIESIAAEEAVDDDEVAIENDQSGRPSRRGPSLANSGTAASALPCARCGRTPPAGPSRTRVQVVASRSLAAAADRWNPMPSGAVRRMARSWQSPDLAW